MNPSKPAESFKGRLALITGASSGIGEAAAVRLAREGLRLILVARRREKLQSVAARVEAAGGQAHVIVADLTNETDRARVLASAQQMGAVEVLINNAGFGWYGYGSRMPVTLAREMLALNVGAAVDLSLSVLPQMVARGRGHIINVSSIAGNLPNQGIAMYAGTKSFLDSFTTALHRELRGTRVHASLIKPGPVRTAFFDYSEGETSGRRIPAERFAIGAEEVAERIWGLVCRPRRVVYVPRVLMLSQWVEPAVGWLIDRLGPLLLRRQPAYERVEERELSPQRTRRTQRRP
ncbi:MAG: SDR family NAD(P)-dependent oxidoreductase [Chloroflexi bacterium]|nr:SDR family NAD(P)-dependent oxidoreductase [Chloroflexota bacterium]